MPTVKYKSGNNWVNVTTSGSIATDSTYGYVKIATDEDVEEGTDNTAAITAKQLKEQLGGSGGLVHIEGAETINGQKTFNNTIIVNNRSIYFKTSEDGTASISHSSIDFKPISSQNHGGYIDFHYAGSSDDYTSRIIEDASGQLSYGGSDARAESNSTTLNRIATVGWVNDPTKSTNVVHRTGDETIAGTKTFSDTIQGTAYRALWGDLAEYYLTDEQYPKGTLVQFGGEKEITIAKNKVNAVITSEPGFILNSEQKDSQAIALIGRVPVRVIGKVKKFDKIALSYIDGVGCVNNDTENPIGIALENKDDSDEGLVICSVKIDLA